MCLLFLMSINLEAQKTKDNNKVSSKECSNLSFNEIEMNGYFNISLSQSDKESVKIEAEQKILDNIETYAKNNILYIKTKDSKKFSDSKKVNVLIGYKNINKIKVNGAVQLHNKEKMNCENLNIEVSGAADIDLNLVVNMLTLQFSGAADCKLKGTAKKVKAEISGAGTVSALELASDVFKIDLSGAGSASINVSEKLDVSISGVGSVSYKGKPKTINKDISFLGSLHHID